MDIPTPGLPQYSEQITSFDNLNIGDSVAVLDNNRDEISNKNNKPEKSRKYYYGIITKKNDETIEFKQPDSSRGIGTSKRTVQGAVIKIVPTESGRLVQTTPKYLRIYKNPTALPVSVAPAQQPAILQQSANGAGQQAILQPAANGTPVTGGGTKRKRRRNKKSKRRYKRKIMS